MPESLGGRGGSWRPWTAPLLIVAFALSRDRQRMPGVQKIEEAIFQRVPVIQLKLGGAMAVATPAPSLAQGVYIGPGGVGVDTGPPRYREPYYSERYHRGDRGYAYERGRFGGCRTVTIERDDGSMRRVR